MKNSTPTQPKRFISLRIKLMVGFTLLFSLVFGAVFYWIYRFTDEQTLGYIQEQLVTTLKGAAKGVDGDLLVALARDGKPNQAGFSDDPRYDTLNDWLQQVKEFEPQAWPYLYLKGSQPDEVIFVVDLWERYNPDKAAPFLYADSYPDLYLGLTDLYVITDEAGHLLITSDQWGDWVSASMPVYNTAGEKVGALGVDFEATYVQETRRAVAQQVTLAFLVSYGILFVVLFFVTKMIAQPVESLSLVARKVGEGHYGERFNRSLLAGTVDEFYVLAETFNDMVAKIDQREQSLRIQVEELRIEIDEVKKQKQVGEIVESEFFRELQVKAQQLRQKREE